MGPINLIRGLIGEKLSLGAQFQLNLKNQNFRKPNLSFTKSIDPNKGYNCKKIKALGQLRVKLKKLVVNDHFTKGVELYGLN